MKQLRVVLAALVALALLAVPTLSLPGEFDSTVDALDSFSALLEVQEALEADTERGDDGSLLQLSASEADAPSYTLPYPAITYGAHAAGGVFTPFTTVNPLGQPWAGFAPVASPAAPLVQPYAAYGALHPLLHPNAAALYPAQVLTDRRGGYNVHGLASQTAYGPAYHPGLAGDLASLGGKASAAAGADAAPAGDNAPAAPAAAESFFERSASQPHDPANIESDASNAAYGLYPASSAPRARARVEFVRSSGGALGPHKVSFASVGSNVLDADFPAFLEGDAEADAEAESELEGEGESELDAEGEAEGEDEGEADEGEDLESEAEAESAIDADVAALLEGEVDAQEDESAELDADDAQLVELALGDDPPAAEAKPEHPTYVLPFPPVLPSHYTPLFNPYTTVNPLSTPYGNYAAQPGAHPIVAAAAAAQAAALASVHGQVVGAAGSYPYYPYAPRHPVIAAQLAGNPVPFSGYDGYIAPQNLNSAAVGENAAAPSAGFPAFVEVATEGTDAGDCQGCSY